jgi:predicted  nucleic acid-binding Zn-ribbon protein
MNEFVQTWYPVFAGLVAAVALGAAIWFRATAKEEARAIVEKAEERLTLRLNSHRNDIDELENSHSAQDKRLVAVEEGLKAFPTVHDIQALGAKLGEVREQMAGMTATMTGMQREFADGQKRTEAALRVMDETLRAKT